MESTFVYINLNAYPVVVNGPFGGPITVPRNRGVKGDYFARFAQPNGPLMMVPENKISPSAIVFEQKAPSDVQGRVWAEEKQKYDPMMSELVPPSIAAPVAVPVVIEEAPVEEVPVEEEAEVEEPVEPAVESKKKGRKTKK
jgi:hypothetical protein